MSGGAGTDTFIVYFPSTTAPAPNTTISDYTFGASKAASEKIIACLGISGQTRTLCAIRVGAAAGWPAAVATAATRSSRVRGEPRHGIAATTVRGTGWCTSGRDAHL